jgi:hypothetical protein
LRGGIWIQADGKGRGEPEQVFAARKILQVAAEIVECVERVLDTKLGLESLVVGFKLSECRSQKGSIGIGRSAGRDGIGSDP